MGIRSAFIGKVGDDELGRLFKKGQEKIGISSILLHGTQSSGRSMVFITPPNAERTFANYMGAALEQEPEDLNEGFFDGYDILHLEGYLVQNHDLVRRAVEIGKKFGMTISIDLASYNVVESNYGFLHDIVEYLLLGLIVRHHEVNGVTRYPQHASGCIKIVSETCRDTRCESTPPQRGTRSRCAAASPPGT